MACANLQIDLSPLIVILNAGDGTLGAALADFEKNVASTVLLADENYFKKNGVDLSHLEGFEPRAALVARRVSLSKAAGVTALVDFVASNKHRQVLLVAEHLAGMAALRALQLFAWLPVPCRLLVGEFGAVPEGLSTNHAAKKAIYSPCEQYQFGAHEVTGSGDAAAQQAAWQCHLCLAAEAISRGGHRHDQNKLIPAALPKEHSDHPEAVVDATREWLPGPSVLGGSLPLVVLFIKDQLDQIRQKVEATYIPFIYPLYTLSTINHHLDTTTRLSLCVCKYQCLCLCIYTIGAGSLLCPVEPCTIFESWNAARNARGIWYALVSLLRPRKRRRRREDAARKAGAG